MNIESKHQEGPSSQVCLKEGRIHRGASRAGCYQRCAFLQRLCLCTLPRAGPGSKVVTLARSSVSPRPAAWHCRAMLKEEYCKDGTGMEHRAQRGKSCH